MKVVIYSNKKINKDYYLSLTSLYRLGLQEIYTRLNNKNIIIQTDNSKFELVNFSDLSEKEKELIIK